MTEKFVIKFTNKLKLKSTNKTKTCTNCLKEENISQFIHLQSGDITDFCLTCRTKRIDQSHKRKEKLKLIIDKLRSVPCEICGDNNPEHHQFDHIIPNEKTMMVTAARTIKQKYEEAKKCRILCMNCHR